MFIGLLLVIIIFALLAPRATRFFFKCVLWCLALLILIGLFAVPACEAYKGEMLKHEQGIS